MTPLDPAIVALLEQLDSDEPDTQNETIDQVDIYKMEDAPKYKWKKTLKQGRTHYVKIHKVTLK